MKIQYCSDLHLEFRENKIFLQSHPITPEAEILVLAGDIVPFNVMDEHKDFFSYVSDNFKTTYWIPGNHEYYYSDISVKSGILHEKITENIFLVNNTSFLHENVKLIFSTLWSKISPTNEWLIERSLSDFQVIKYKGRRFSAPVFNTLYEESLDFIQKEIKHVTESKSIVVSHHVPTLFNYPSEYKGSMINEAFASELFPIIEDSTIDYWIYGHHHTNQPAFKIGKTTLLTNQLGYVSQNEHHIFVPGSYLTI